MSKLNFPDSPTDGEIYAAPNNVTYTWDATVGVWTAKPADPLTLQSVGSISGNTQIGSTLTYEPGTAAGGVPPYAYTWEWSRLTDGSVIQKDGLTLEVPVSLLGDNVYIQLTVTDANSDTVSGATEAYPQPPDDFVPAPFPFTVFTPEGGPNASPASVSLPSEGLYGTATATWVDGITDVFTTGDLRVSVNGSNYTSSSQQVVNGDTVTLIWDSAAVAAAADGFILEGSLTNGAYANDYILAVDRQPNFFSFANLKDQPLSTEETSNSITPTGFNVPISASFAGTSTPLTLTSISVGGGAFGSSPQTVIPGQSIQMRGTTGGANSTAYGVDVALGSPATTATWTVTTTSVSPTISEPVIISPENGSTNINPATNEPAQVTVVGSDYVGLNGAGSQTGSTWDVYADSYPLVSTNAITGVTSTGPVVLENEITLNSTTSAFAGGNGSVILVRSSTSYYISEDAGLTWQTRSITGITGIVSVVQNYILVRDTVSYLGLRMIGYNGGTSTRLEPNGYNPVEVAYSSTSWGEQQVSDTNGLITDNLNPASWVFSTEIDPLKRTRGKGRLNSAGTVVSGTNVTDANQASSGFSSNFYYNGSRNRNLVVRKVNGVNTLLANGTEVPDGPTSANFFWIGGSVWINGNNATPKVTTDNGLTWTTTLTLPGAPRSKNLCGGYVVWMMDTGDDVTSHTVCWATASQVAQGFYGTTTLTTSFAGYLKNIIGTPTNSVYVFVDTNGKTRTMTGPAAPVSYTELTIAGCQSDGFLVGDIVVSDPAGGGPSTIFGIDDTKVTLTYGTGWAVGQKIARDSSTYTAITGSPFTLSSSPYTYIDIPQSSFSTSTKYYARVQYASASVTSNYSAWSSFTTSSNFRPVIGQSLGGGYYGGQINDGGTIYNLIVAPRVSGGLLGEYSTDGGLSPAGLSYKTSNTGDSPTTVTANRAYGGDTSALLLDGVHPLFDWLGSATGPNAGVFDITGASNGTGIGGYNDWYIPAIDELEVLYYYLKPTGASNLTTSGSNAYAVAPEPVSTNYTASSPTQTTATLFQFGGSEDFSRSDQYWTATQGTSSQGRKISFTDGSQTTQNKITLNYARAIRRRLA